MNPKATAHQPRQALKWLLLGFSLLMAFILALALANQVNYLWQLPKGFPKPLVPSDNPMSEAKVELGRYLFYDPKLSANAEQACASCHVQQLAFSDGKVLPIGSTGEMLQRNAPSLVNVAYNATLTWANPVLTEVEKQVLIPMFAEFPVELGITGHEAKVLQRFNNDANYLKRFQQAFPDEADPINFHNIVKALSSFLRTLISGNSPYDRFVYGRESEALSDSAKRGMDLFFSEKTECHHCHGGFNFSHSVKHQNNQDFVEFSFHNTGLYNLDGKGSYPLGNRGVFELSGEAQDMGAFRAPSLRNVALTAPYMHDGSVASLEEVIRLYEAGGRVIEEGALAGDGRQNPFKSGFVQGIQLNDQERADLISFLESLSDPSFLEDPRFANPFESD